MTTLPTLWLEFFDMFSIHQTLFELKHEHPENAIAAAFAN
jgi:hypothetical protein